MKQYTNHPPGDTPDYKQLFYWAAHPLKKDPSDSVSLPLKTIYKKNDSVLVFFIHPTTYTTEITDGWNASINNALINAKTDYTSILFQSSVFNEFPVYAPRYRQAHLSAFFTRDSSRAKKAFDLAYGDIKTAFLLFINNYCAGRPFIIASHSQGTVHAARLIKELVENTPLEQKFIAAYLIGMPIQKDYFSYTSPCKDSFSTGCFVSWRTFRNGYTPGYVKREKLSAFVTNPLTWASNTELIPSQFNHGAILLKFNKVIPATNSAQVHNNILWISKPKFPWGFLYWIRNYHVADINLFYMNIRQNLRTRVRSWYNRDRSQLLK